MSARQDGDSLVIEVTDSGIGTAFEDQPEIFDRFFPSSSATHLAVPGAGLGLSITKTIVEEHGGRIAVSSKPMQGTRMTVTLPLHALARADDAASTAAPSSRSLSAGALSS